MLVPPESSSTVLLVIRSKSVSICNCFHARRTNSGKMTPSNEGNPLTQRHENLSQKTRVLAVAHSEDNMILSCVVSTQYSSVTDRQTDRQKDASAVAKTRLALRRIIKSMLGVYADHLNSQYIGPLTHSVWCVPALL